MRSIIRRLSAILFAVIFTFSMPIAAYAIDVDVSYGDVSIGDTQVTHTKEAGGSAVTEDHDGSVTVTGTTTENNISVDVSAGNTVEVTLQDVSIDTTRSDDTTTDGPNFGKAAMDISGEGNVVVELDGENSLTSPTHHAGLETSQDGGSLTIQDENNVAGSLTAEGGAAGIGGGDAETGSNITISGGTVEATGGGAGIGGGFNGSGSDIKITGGEVTASSKSGGAGIGGGSFGAGSGIEISGGEVTANGHTGGAGIGGGSNGTGSGIEISGGEVNATGSKDGAGIGGGKNGSGSDISISGDAQVTASGRGNAADVGGGAQSTDTAKQENNVDTSKLTTQGSINGVAGTYVPPSPAPETPASSSDYYYVQAPAEPYTVSEDYTKTEKDGVLTIIVKGEEAELEITAEGIRELIADGFHTLVFVTDKAETQVVLYELVKDCADTDEFVITHKGEVTTITLNGEEVK